MAPENPDSMCFKPKRSKTGANGKPEENFEDTFFTILGNVNSSLLEIDSGDMNETLEWLRNVIRYNVPNGKQGRMTLMAFQNLVNDPTKNQMKLATILGWCVEILQAGLLVADDIMDNGQIRRGRPCWHLKDNLGNIAFNDAFLLEHFALQLLRIYFGNDEIYPELLDIFLGTTFRTMMGQSLDTRMSKEQNFDRYSLSMYLTMITYKTSYYTVYLPVALAMTLAGLSSKSETNRELWNSFEQVSLKIGTLFQIQDDYLDCYADRKDLGKVGTDIQEGKCTWLFVEAKQRCTKEQMAILKTNYGSVNADNVQRVKQIYEKLSLENVYHERQKELCNEINDMINTIPHKGLKIFFRTVLDKMYGRMY